MASSYTLSTYTECKAKRQRVQWDSQRVQLHPLQPPSYGFAAPAENNNNFLNELEASWGLEGQACVKP